jgi:hypothetical protein
MDSNEMFGVQDAVLILTSCIDNLKGILLVLNLGHLAECVLDGRIVALDEVVVYISDSERGFACDQ